MYALRFIRLVVSGGGGGGSVGGVVALQQLLSPLANFVTA